MLYKTGQQLKETDNRGIRDELHQCYLKEFQYSILDVLCWKEDNVLEDFYLFSLEATECSPGASAKTCRMLDMMYRVADLARNICRMKKHRLVKPRRKRQFSEYDILHSIKTATCETSDEEYVNIGDAYKVISGEIKPYNSSANHLAIRQFMCCTMHAAMKF